MQETHQSELSQCSADQTNDKAGKSGLLSVPWDVCGRIGLLFGVLCLIKVFMLVGFHKHLYEIHWRVSSAPVGWLNLTFYYLFIVLVGLNLWNFSIKCSSAGNRTIRAANACILILGLAFIFLTFHAGDNNYLYPVLDGTLHWWDLKAYLELAFFFQKPYLGGWLLAYLAIYYVLARNGRENLTLYVTTIFATVYLFIFMQELTAFGNSLLILDCLGIACLLTGSFASGKLNLFYWVQPYVWLILFFLIFRVEDEDIRNLTPSCAILSGWSLVLFAGCTIMAWKRKFYAGWTWFLPFGLTIFLLLTNANYPLSHNFRNLFCLGLTLPRYFTGEFFLALILLVVAKWYRAWLPRASLVWLDIVSLALIIEALLDLRLTQIMGIRLDWQAIAFGADFKMVWREAKPYLPGIAVGLLLTIALYAILIGLWQRNVQEKPVKMGRGGWFMVTSFLLLALAGNFIAQNDKARGQSAIVLLKTSPLFRLAENPVMPRKTFMDTAHQLGLEQMLARPATVADRPLRRLNVVMIFQESTYNRYLSLFDGKRNTEPLLSAYTNRMELFPNFFSNYAGSINARFAAFSGLYPVADYKAFTLDHVNVKSIFDILHGEGYQCSLFYSSYLDYTGFRDFLNDRGLDTMYDADTMPGVKNAPSLTWGLNEEDTVNAIRSQIRQYATNGQTFFLTYVPVAPHNPFDGVPPRFNKYRLEKIGDFTPLYLNDLEYMDWCITSIVDQLKDSGLLDNTLVVITDDHGEMLGENGGPIGHGWAAPPRLTNIPLIIMDPGNPGYHVNDTVGSQVDLLPTVLDLLGIPVPAGQLYQGTSLYSSQAQADRIIYLNSFQQYGIIKGDRYVLGNRETQNQGTFSKLTENPTEDVYSITNKGAKTSFVKMPAADVPIPSISEFDQFQNNLLKNYTLYCQMFQN